MDRVFSGIQPTGQLHIGNYLGAIRSWVDIQQDYPCIFCIVDYHAITVDYDIATMPKRVVELATGLLACGVDPEKATLFVQSNVPAHTELAWIFNALTPMGELSRQTQFKSKASQNMDNVNVGLFTYPVLQAADILLYKANRVPVGKDQEQHLELAREIVRKFNGRFGNTFPEPKTMFSSTPKIRGLDGQAKMSKSLNNTIAVNEPEEVIRKKLSKAFTDPNRKRKSDPGDPSICNVYALHEYFSDDTTNSEISADCRSAKIGCVDCKGRLATNMVKSLAPIRERWHDLERRPDDVRDVLSQGGQQCRLFADETMNEVRQKMGLCVSNTKGN